MYKLCIFDPSIPNLPDFALEFKIKKNLPHYFHEFLDQFLTFLVMQSNTLDYRLGST